MAGAAGPAPEVAGTTTRSPQGADIADARTRILEAALRLMAEGGLHATSMRALASEVGLNVATIYHYFPSKQQLFDEAIAEQHAAMLMGEPPAMDPGATPAERLEALLNWLLSEIHEQGEHTWRLMLGESLRGEPTVRSVAAELSAAFEATLAEWLIAALPELGGRADGERLARCLRAAVYGVVVESLLVEEDWPQVLRARAREMAVTMAPSNR